jgi:protein tyrosine/serine phosphatase
MSVPVIRASWWVEDGKLLAGPVPAEHGSFSRVKKLLAYGVNAFMDLRDHRESIDGYPSVVYHQLLPSSIEYLNVPMFDGTAPTMMENMDCMLDTIAGWIKDGRMTYVHCHGGHGRTGLVMACWFIRSGLSSMKAINELYKLRVSAMEALGRISCPQTSDQVKFAMDYEKYWRDKDPKGTL